MQIAWGKKLSPAAKCKVLEIAAQCGMDPNHLMAAMAFETGETFSPKIKNSHSSATGLIQFMAATAKALGTTTTALAAMTVEQQLDYVEAYFRPWRGRLKTLSDVYMAILWPRGIGKPESYVLWAKGTPAYAVNWGLDTNRDGAVTKAEAAAKVHAKLIKGLSDQWRG
jgi:hypothetical protein